MLRATLTLIATVFIASPARSECPTLFTSTLELKAADIEAALKASLASDISGFCKSSLEQNLAVTKQLTGTTAGEREKNLLRLAGEGKLDSWTASLYPSLDVRVAGLFGQNSLWMRKLNNTEALKLFLEEKYKESPPAQPLHPVPSSPQNANSQPSGPTNLPPGGESPHNKGATVKVATNQQGDEISKVASPLALRAACMEISFNPGCPAALSDAIQLARPDSLSAADPIPYKQLYGQVLLDRKYDEGLRLAALKLLYRIKSRDVKKADLFSDVKNSFLAAGVSQSDASEMSWKTLALIATGGPHVSARAEDFTFDYKTRTSKVALATISSLAPALDLLSTDSGSIYSYPPQIKTSCETGKSYHFWLTAYLARDLVKRAHSLSNASAAAFTAQKGYEMFDSGSGRDPAKPLVEETFSPYSNTLRMDLAYSGAAAVYGARAATGTPDKMHSDIDVDAGLSKIILGSKMIPRSNLDDANKLVQSTKSGGISSLWSAEKYVSRWNKTINPDAAFYYFQNGK